jgi:hypothetical protein
VLSLMKLMSTSADSRLNFGKEPRRPPTAIICTTPSSYEHSFSSIAALISYISNIQASPALNPLCPFVARILVSS